MLKPSSNEDEFIGFIQRWFRLLADGQIHKACTLIDEPNCYGVRWTKALILEVVQENFGEGTVFNGQYLDAPKFCYPESAAGEYRADVLEFDDGSGFSVEHDVPLNGEWSDLTAQFEFLRRPNGFAVVLHDLHVL